MVDVNGLPAPDFAPVAPAGDCFAPVLPGQNYSTLARAAGRFQILPRLPRQKMAIGRRECAFIVGSGGENRGTPTPYRYSQRTFPWG